jgi:hypothetical protein
MAVHDNIGTRKDPHMKSPAPKYILIVIIVALLVIFVAPKIYEIYQDNLKDTENRAEKRS